MTRTGKLEIYFTFAGMRWDAPATMLTNGDTAGKTRVGPKLDQSQSPAVLEFIAPTVGMTGTLTAALDGTVSMTKNIEVTEITDGDTKKGMVAFSFKATP